MKRCILLQSNLISYSSLDNWTELYIVGRSIETTLNYVLINARTYQEHLFVV